MGSLCLVLEAGWELAEVCALASHVQVPECIAARSVQSFLGSLGAPGLEEEVGFSTFPWEFGDEASPSFGESSLAASCSSYFYKKGHTMSSCLHAPCREKMSFYFSLGE